MFSREREGGLCGVIEFGAGPIDSGMALRAILWEAGAGVIRTLGGLILREVARTTRCAQGGVLFVGMALSTGGGGVLASERKLGSAVVKTGGRPSDSGMAELAILRETGAGMVRVLGGLKVGQVARTAGRAQGGVLSIAMALSTGGGDVFASERKLGRAVVKTGGRPSDGGMAELAVLGESGSGMAGALGGLEVRQMARAAGRALGGVLSVGMALGARRTGVLAG